MIVHRRHFALGLPIAAVTIAAGPTAAQRLPQLLKADMKGGMPLMEALAKRRSQRSFADKPLPSEQMSRMLWAAFGVNRPSEDGRTAPSWRGSKEIDIYIATREGVHRYDPMSHRLVQHMSDDIRAQTGRAEFAGTAPAVLIYVADLTRMAKATPDDQRLYAHVDGAIIAQNVYLFAASEELATVMLGNVDRQMLARTLKLPETQIVTFTQPIGEPG